MHQLGIEYIHPMDILGVLTLVFALPAAWQGWTGLVADLMAHIKKTEILEFGSPS